MIKRSFDLCFAIIGILLLLPFFLIISIVIKIESKGPVFFVQERVGQNNIDFNLYKFRTMYEGSQQKGLLTIGNNDSRTTKVGSFLRKFKFDELPQLFNIIKGNMSFVGPRPELRYFVNFYKNEDFEVLKLKPSITGIATLKYINESELIKASTNAEAYYINEIIPDKLRLNKRYLEEKSFCLDIKLILLTLNKLFKIVVF
ncbi:MAG: sugar transferase [Jejuia sp.]